MRSGPVTVLIALLLAGAWARPAQASSWSGLQANALRCLQGGQDSACQTAILQAESLARRATARNAFPCQTLLLGLQADFIMQQLGDGRGAQAIDAVASTGRGCAGL